MATWNAIIGASSDDARQAAGVVTLTDANIGMSAGTNWAGLRWPSCPIPNGAAISAATLTLNLNSGKTTPNGLIVWGEDEDNAATFAATSNNISGRTMTTASVTWTGGALGTGDKSPPDLSAIVAEITSRAGWAAGNALALILDGVAGMDFEFPAYDGSTTLCARLVVVYGTTGLTKQAMYYARMRG